MESDKRSVVIEPSPRAISGALVALTCFCTLIGYRARIGAISSARILLDRVSISPSETKVCFEYQKGYQYKDTGRTLYIADFDAKKPSITNAKAFANEEGANRWFAYPRWTKDEKAIVYHASPSLYLYTLEDGATVKVSTRDGADYRYPHCEATPK